MWTSLLLAVAAAAPLPPHAPDWILVKAKPGEVLAVGESVSRGALVEASAGVPGWYRVSVTKTPQEHLSAARKNPKVAEAELDVEVRFEAYEDEPQFNQQWWLESDGHASAAFDIDVDALDAWDAGATGEGVVVAIIDTGVDIFHPDLVDALWTNPGEIPDNGIDDDGNGYIDDVHGIDAANETGNPLDLDGHGTDCAGIVAAQPTGWGPIGLAPAAEIMSIKIAFGQGSFGSISARAITYAADNGARVLSNSWTYGPQEVGIVRDAMKHALDQGVIFVAAAGNDGDNADVVGNYPARSQADGVLGVGAINKYGLRVNHPGVWSSAYGAGTIDLMAPGEDVWTLNPGYKSGSFGGTSAATPAVAGAVALLWSIDPELDRDALIDVLLNTVDPLDRDDAPVISGGSLNAGAAVRSLALGIEPVRPNTTLLTPPERFTPLTWQADVDGDWTWVLPSAAAPGAPPLTGASPSFTFEVPGDWRIHGEVVTADGATGHGMVDVSLPIPWVDVDLEPIESAHDGSQPYKLSAIDVDEDAVWTRYHFERIELKQGSDPESLMLRSGEETLWSFTGEAEDLWTPALPGGPHLLISQQRSGLAPSWGFKLDAAQIWHAGVDHVDVPDTGEEPRTGGCSHSPRGAGLGLLLLLLTARRRR